MVKWLGFAKYSIHLFEAESMAFNLDGKFSNQVDCCRRSLLRSHLISSYLTSHIIIVVACKMLLMCASLSLTYQHSFVEWRESFESTASPKNKWNNQICGSGTVHKHNNHVYFGLDSLITFPEIVRRSLLFTVCLSLVLAIKQLIPWLKRRNQTNGLY